MVQLQICIYVCVCIYMYIYIYIYIYLCSYYVILCLVIISTVYARLFKTIHVTVCQNCKQKSVIRLWSAVINNSIAAVKH